MITRREFGKYAGQGALALGIGEVSMGLSCENIYNDIMAYIPVGLTAFQTIVTLINPVEGTVIAGLVTEVKAALSDVQAAVTNYENAPAAQKTTLAGKIATAIEAAETELQSFWSALNLPDGNLATLVEGIINVILSTLAAFLPQLPAPDVLPAKALVMRASSKRVNFTAKKRSLKQFKSDLNTEFTKAGYAPVFK